MRLQDKVAVVTGASRGIGEAIAIGYAREGAKVVLAARSEDDLRRVATEIEGLGGEVLIALMDVTDEGSVKAMAQAAKERFGRIDILVNNAGGAMWKPIWATSLNTWEWLINVNLKGPFLCSKHVWRIMQAGGGGSIINVGSTSGSRAYPYFAAYSSSKWGLVGLTKSTSEEGKADHIRVNCLNPAKVRTAQRAAIKDKEPIMEAEDLVGMAVFLASDDAKYVTGQVIEMEYPSTENDPRARRARRRGEGEGDE